MSTEFWIGVAVGASVYVVIFFIAMFCFGVREYIKQSKEKQG